MSPKPVLEGTMDSQARILVRDSGEYLVILLTPVLKNKDYK